MQVLAWLAAVVFLAAIGVAAWVRLAPDDPARWHVDPLTAAPTGRPNSWRVGPADGDVNATAPAYGMSPDALAAAFDAVVRAQPRTTRLAGAPADLWVTYVQRSRLWGFPDYASVRFLDAGEGRSTLAIYSRARYGTSDLGVNRARVEAWLAALPPAG